MAENPACWTPAEKTIHRALSDYEKSMAAGIVGWSRVKCVAEALREAGHLKEDA